MKYIAFVLFHTVYFSLAAQGGIPGNTNPVAGPQQSINLDTEEKRLDDLIRNVYDSMQLHARIIPLKVKDLPRNTLITKGKGNGDDCVEEKAQEEITNNCLKLEIFDFVGVGTGIPSPVGAKSKTITLFFDSDGADKNPRTAPPRKLTKVKLRVISDDLLNLDKKMVQIIDDEPLAQGDHNDKISFVAEYDSLPLASSEEKPSEFSYGKYKLSQMDNTKSSPIRVQFKRENLFKHLRFFHEIYTKIYEFNDNKLVNRVRENNKNVLKALNY